MNKCSLDLILLIIDQVALEAKSLKAKMETKEMTLKEKYHATYPAIDSSIKDAVAKYKDKLLSIKLKKYKCYTEDYVHNQIYQWDRPEQAAAAPETPARRPLRTERDTTATHRQRTSSEELTSLESDFTFDSDSDNAPSTSFLLQRRRLPPRGRGKSGAGGTQQPAVRRLWTRRGRQTR